MKRDVVSLGEKTVEGVGFKRRGRRRSGMVLEKNTCTTLAAFDYRTYVQTSRAKPETVWGGGVGG